MDAFLTTFVYTYSTSHLSCYQTISFSYIQTADALPSVDNFGFTFRNYIVDFVALIGKVDWYV